MPDSPLRYIFRMPNATQATMNKISEELTARNISPYHTGDGALFISHEIYVLDLKKEKIYVLGKNPKIISGDT